MKQMSFFSTRKITFLTKMTAGGLMAVSIALSTQWLSGDPAYPTFPPGLLVFLVVAAVVIWGARWWWTPLIAALFSLLVTAGWVVDMPKEMLRLEHPGKLGGFAPGIFAGTLLLIVALVFTDVSGIAATMQNLRRRGKLATDGAKLACRLFGALFLVVGTMMIIGGGHVNQYHNLMHLTWGVLALAISFLGAIAVRRYLITSGAFFLTLAILGLSLGNPAADHAWRFGPMLLHSADHVFHLVIGLTFLGIGLASELSSPTLERAKEV